jgi:hypothetical protein
MTTLTIEIPEKVEKTFSDLVVLLGGRIIVPNTNKKKGLSKKEKQILDDLEESVKWVRLYQEGKVQAKSIEELLNEL